MKSLLAAFLGMMAFGVSNVFWKPLSQKGNLFRLLTWRSVWTLLIFFATGVFLCLVRPGYSNSDGLAKMVSLTPSDVLASIAFILVSLTGLILFIQSQKWMPVGLAGTIICIASLISTGLSWMYLHEVPNTFFLIGISLSLVGIGLMENSWKTRSLTRKGIALALSAACCWGFANLGFKQLIPRVGTLTFSIFQETTVFVFSAAAFIAAKDPLKTRIRFFEPMIVWISLCTVLGVALSNAGMKTLPLHQFSLVVMAQPLTTLLLSHWWLRESLENRQKVGVLLLLIGIYVGLQ